MARYFLCAMAIGLLALAGCAPQEKVSKPDAYAPPPAAASQKGDTAPGPP